jgi:CheY-like chemotaxis protein
LVEDDPAVRLLARLVLELHGYAVLETADAEEALAVAGRHGGRIDLLVTDVGLPGIGGLELADRLCGLRRGLPVLYTTGGGEQILAGRTLPPGAALLAKPFVPAVLARSVRQTIAASRGGPEEEAAAYCGLD